MRFDLFGEGEQGSKTRPGVAQTQSQGGHLHQTTGPQFCHKVS